MFVSPAAAAAAPTHPNRDYSSICFLTSRFFFYLVFYCFFFFFCLHLFLSRSNICLRHRKRSSVCRRALPDPYQPPSPIFLSLNSICFSVFTNDPTEKRVLRKWKTIDRIHLRGIQNRFCQSGNAEIYSRYEQLFNGTCKQFSLEFGQILEMFVQVLRC